MPYELIITNTSDLSIETIGFGNDKPMAERVFSWTWQGLLHEGYIAITNDKAPNVIEFVQRKGTTAMFVELRERPTFDIAKMLRVFHILALDAMYPKYFASGVMQADVVRTEYARKNAKYVAQVIQPDGSHQRHVLPVERIEAIKAFNKLVREAGCTMQAIDRCEDADMKWTVRGEQGATTFEFVEVQREPTT